MKNLTILFCMLAFIGCGNDDAPAPTKQEPVAVEQVEQEPTGINEPQDQETQEPEVVEQEPEIEAPEEVKPEPQEPTRQLPPCIWGDSDWSNCVFTAKETK